MLAATGLMCALLAHGVNASPGVDAGTVDPIDTGLGGNFISHPRLPGKPPTELLHPVAAQAQAAANPPVCEGDGVSGKRIRVLYVREADQPDRYATMAPLLRAFAAGVDDIFNDSAAKTGGSRHIRYVTTAGPNCQVDVGNIVLPKGGYAQVFDRAARADNYSPDRNYVLFSENTACGGTSGDTDEQPGPANRFNKGGHWSEIGVGCWSTNGYAHELGHLLGAVMPGAPHFQGGSHCSQEWDIMCYEEPQDYEACPSRANDMLLDCGNDDYFHTNPPAGSYLATHWNVANSAFLIKGDKPDNNNGHAQAGKLYTIAGAGGKVIDVENSSIGNLGRLALKSPTGAQSQKWIIGYETGQQLVNGNSQLCADSDNSGTRPGTQMVQYRCVGQNSMRWTFQPLGNGRVAIFNGLSGLVITDGATLSQQTYTGAANQQWTLNPIADPGVKSNVPYYLANAANGYAAAVFRDTPSGSKVVSTPRKDESNHKWKLVAAKDYWKVVNVNTGLCLAPVSGSTREGTQMEQAKCGSSSSQQWKLVHHNDTQYGLVNRASGLALRQVIGGTDPVLEQRPYLGGKSRETVWGFVPA